MHAHDAYDDIPGTIVFTGARSLQGYHLNMFCMSLMKPDNRAAFAADGAAYLNGFPMTASQRDAVLKRDWSAMLELGGNVYFMVKLAATDGLSVQRLCALMSGSTPQDYAEMMLRGGRSIQGNRSKSERDSARKRHG